VAYALIPTTSETETGRISVQEQQGQIFRKTLICKITRAKMDQGCGSKGRAPALQAQSPEFKHQSHPKKKKKKKELPYDPAIPLLGIQSKEIKIHCQQQRLTPVILATQEDLSLKPAQANSS
jgi:hypothetical protein